MSPPPEQADGQAQIQNQNQPTPDSITNEQIKLLEESGLIAQQSRLSEGLLLMDRQLRQAQLVEQLLQVLGPDAQIEVTPGEFKTFQDTPAGLRERIAYLELQLQLKEAQEKMGAVAAGPITSTVTEVFGVADDYTAVINSNGSEGQFGEGDRLADGSVILSISPDEVRIQSTDGTIRALDTP
jgi:hypothetical protein